MAGDYFAKLKDPRWQKLRLQVLERDEWTCECCGATDKTLHVHHGYYEGKYDPWDYDPDTLHVVCEECHDHANCLRRDVQFEMAHLRLDVQESLLFFMNCLRIVGPGDQLATIREAIEPYLEGIPAGTGANGNDG